MNLLTFFMKMDEFVVYVLYSPESEKTYTGFTSDLLNRMRSHNFFGTSDFTSKYRPWIVIHLEYYSDKSTAIKRERELKSGKGREFVRKEILPKYIA